MSDKKRRQFSSEDEDGKKRNTATGTGAFVTLMMTGISRVSEATGLNRLPGSSPSKKAAKETDPGYYKPQPPSKQRTQEAPVQRKSPIFESSQYRHKKRH